MTKKFSMEWYSEEVNVVITSPEPNEQEKKRIVGLTNDARLNEIEERIVKQWHEAMRAFEAAPADLQRRREYSAATLQISHSPWRALRTYIEKLPLLTLFEMQSSSSEIRALFVERLREADDCNRKAVSKSRQSMALFFEALTHDERMGSTLKCKQSFPRAAGKSRKEELPHPLGAIVRDSTKGGGKLGATLLARKLNEYCTKQLAAYVEGGKRNDSSKPAKTRVAHIGKMNAMGVLTAIYSPANARRRMKDAIVKILEGERKDAFSITVRHIERVLDSSTVKKYLARHT